MLVLYYTKSHRINMKLDLQSLFRLHEHSCTHWPRHRNPLPHPPHLGSYTRALLVSQNRRHLFDPLRRGIIVYMEYQSVCPFVGIGSTHSLPRKRVISPLGPEGWSYTRFRVRVLGTQFGRLGRKPGTLYTLWYYTTGLVFF